MKPLICNKCGVILTEDNWAGYARNRGHRICLDCRRKQQRAIDRKPENVARSKEYHRVHREQRIKTMRKYSLKSVYGLTLDDFNRMFEDQNGCCKLCGKHQSELKKSLHIDHNHVTGEVRGLLCSDCNLLLGRVEESPVRIIKMLGYLKYEDGVIR